jgi:hypothetical protein
LFGQENELHFPIVHVLDFLAELFPPFYYEITEDRNLPENVHAETDVLRHTIKIKQSVYDGACIGKGRDRMTIAHELGHYFLICKFGLRLHRTFSTAKLRAFEDPE